jgi:hypothetical protein
VPIASSTIATKILLGIAAPSVTVIPTEGLRGCAIRGLEGLLRNRPFVDAEEAFETQQCSTLYGFALPRFCRLFKFWLRS